MAFPMLISDAAVARYATGPSQARLDQAAALRQAVEEALGSDYQVFLQGSYRNSTGVADLNDVDVVALSKSVHSTVDVPGPNLYPVSWDEIFSRVERRLEADRRFSGRVSRGDKCVKVATALALDVVPAIYRGTPSSDPVEVYSFREASRRDNYPREHFAKGAEKNSDARTAGAYKPTVRMFKAWARNMLGPGSDVAPSFYIECLVHHVADDQFSASSLPLSFAAVGAHICSKISRSTVVYSVAGDKDILVQTEWAPEKFEAFRESLLPSVDLAIQALEASTITEADRLWRRAFNE